MSVTSSVVITIDFIDDKTPIEAMAEEVPVRAEIAKSARPSVLQKLHSYEKPNKTDSKKHKEEVL